MICSSKFGARASALFGARASALTLHVGLVGLVGFASAPRLAHADDASQTTQPFSAENLATAREALREGLALRDAGDVPGALAKLHLAHTLVAIPVTAYELGRTEMQLGHLLTARELFLEVGRLPRSIEESERSETARRESAKLATDLEPRIPALRFHLTLAKDAAPSTAVVRVDGVVVPSEALDAPRRVNPGAHDVIAKSGDGPEQRVSVVVKESELKDVDLAPQWIPPKEPPAPGRPFYMRSTTNPALFVGVGLIAVGAITTTVGLIAHFQGQSMADSECFSHYCLPAATQSFKDAAGGSTVAWIGGIGMAVGVAGIILGVQYPVQHRVYTGWEPVIGPNSIGVRGAF